MGPTPAHRGLCTSREYEGRRISCGLVPTEGPVETKPRQERHLVLQKTDGREYV